MSSSHMNVALIGLGKMGTVLGQRILLGNFPLTVYNRTAIKMQPLTHLGAKGAQTTQEAVQNADVVITCLFDDAAVLETVQGKQGFLSALKPNAIHIGTSTILPQTSKILSQLHKEQGSIYIAANVLGVPKVAQKGELTTIVAGDKQTIEKLTGLFHSYSSTIIHVGIEPFHANVVKICMNYLLASAIETMGEIYTFAEKNTVDLNIIHTLFHNVFAHPAFKLYIDKIKARNFEEVNFSLDGGFKDLRLFQTAFADARVVPDVANILMNKFLIALAQGMETKDWSAVTEVTRQQSGL